MILFDSDDEQITVESCMAQAIGQLERATYQAQGDMDRMASAQVAIAWMMLADRVVAEEPPVHLG